MNSADKKRIEQMLRERAKDALYRAEDALEHPRPKLPKSIEQRLNSALANMTPTDASIERMDAAVEAADEAGFSIQWQRPRKADFYWNSAPRQESHPALIAHREAKITLVNTVRDARDVAIIALWSSDEFDLQGYFSQIDASVTS